VDLGVIVRQRARGGAAAAGFLAVVALTAIAIIAAYALLRAPGTAPAATGSPGPSAPIVAVSPSPMASPTPTATAAPSPTPRGQWADTKYGFTVILPEPYRPSALLTREFTGSQHPAARDVFTVRSPSDEQASMQGQDCEVQCDAWNGAAVVLIYTDAGSMTPRQWFEAGNTPGSPGRLTDVTIDGRPALKIEPSGPYNVMYVVADGKGRMFHLAYQFFHVAAAPPGATIAKVEEIFASFRFI
jgi:hypothetical protein